MTAASSCFHCGNEIFDNAAVIYTELPEHKHPVCCLGCKAVTEHIYQTGLANYYEFRTDKASKPEEDFEAETFSVYDDEKYLSLVADISAADQAKIILTIDNIHCAACAWLIEQSVMPLKGIEKITVNTVNQRAEIQWDNTKLSLSSILAKMSSIGYPASPFKVTDTEQQLKRSDKQFIKRLGVAGLFTMQVMMIAFAMYFGAFENMESHQVGYFKWLSMLLSVPVIFYSALPFLFGCYYSIKAKKLNMDVPVATAIYGAFFVSLYQLIDNGLNGLQGEVFFESICMFTFLLLIGKYLEFKAKSKAILSNANLNKSIPITVIQIKDGVEQTILVKELGLGDTILVRAGETLPVDGIIHSGDTSVNESVLNGEFQPVSKTIGDTVFAGSINNDGVISVRVTATGDSTTLAHISQLQAEFSTHKPKYTEFADKIAHWFVFGQLVLAAITYVIWYFYSPQDALWVSLSVLVATCPCSLSLATPTAYTCIMSALNRKGILIKDPKSFDRLNHVSHIAFDKTGTLTKGRFEILHTDAKHKFSESLKAAVVKLQKHSEHPIAKAFSAEKLNVSETRVSQIKIENVKLEVGQGIEGFFDGKALKIGKAEFVGVVQVDSTHNVFVSYAGVLVASFEISDQVKIEAKQSIDSLRKQGMHPVMLTGDSSHLVMQVAQELDIGDYRLSCSPSDKADYVKSLQVDKHCVLMVGDGINDAPVFAAADISIAMGDGSDITKHSADIIIVKGNLNAINQLKFAAEQTRLTIKQNLYWSLVYNAVILPVAMLGFVAPYIAVIGMSASSILVVTHSLKLLKL